MADSSENVDPPAGGGGQSIERLDSLPVFFRAAGRRIPVIGGSDAVGWKVELLMAAGANVEVFSARPSDRLSSVLASRPGAVLYRRAWTPADLTGALAVVAEADGDEEALALREAARDAGVPLNVIDRPAFCDFQFGSIVNRSPVVIGISTGGAAPVFGQALRARIETLLPRGFSRWAEAARRWRAQIASLELPFRERRRFWELFTAQALARPADEPDDAERETLLAEASAAGKNARTRGKALLVGAGPGDPELMTLRAVRAIQSADVILYDDLASPAILEMARREAEKIDVGKRAARASPHQGQISALLVDLVASGKNVVRLKGGDPMIFGRANEEIRALRASRLDFEIIPGVTAASAAAATLQMSLTDRDLASRVQFVSGHGPDGALPADLRWEALADPASTTVVYMGVRTIRELAERLAREGLPGGTPVALVENASRANQRTLSTTLDHVAEAAGTLAPEGPCLVLIGAALGTRARG